MWEKANWFQFIIEIFKQSSPGENAEGVANNNHPDFLTIEPDSLLETKNSKVHF